uniref:Uncharacterized protein n=1 Tax=Arundo donax TaxID=35708 RepID=A0A0A9CB85_ARUDO
MGLFSTRDASLCQHPPPCGRKSWTWLMGRLMKASRRPCTGFVHHFTVIMPPIWCVIILSVVRCANAIKQSICTPRVSSSRWTFHALFGPILRWILWKAFQRLAANQ